MKTIRLLLALGLLAIALGGCARGPRQADIDVVMPTLKPGYGRIYFLRSSAFIGSPVQPEIQLNRQVVGRSRARGFFFVDRPAGPYRASSSTSVSSNFHFDLNPGEVKYVRTEVTIAMMGIMPGSVAFSLMDEAVAEPELRKLSYTGRTLRAEKKPMPEATPAPASMPTPSPATATAPAAVPMAVPTPTVPTAVSE